MRISFSGLSIKQWNYCSTIPPKYPNLLWFGVHPNRHKFCCFPQNIRFLLDDLVEEVFEEVEPILRSALDGHNICIFAYGQTGTGKTFTMVSKGNWVLAIQFSCEFFIFSSFNWWVGLKFSGRDKWPSWNCSSSYPRAFSPSLSRYVSFFHFLHEHVGGLHG